ncbi:MAG TPA: aminodeoxychorismate synthase component I [Steroidobacteraceae bacterium]|jgi:anthranilate synthase component 1|nr:aminodeoxychorismate synthase component I [Steroidobacteraceae bacterium]
MPEARETQWVPVSASAESLRQLAYLDPVHYPVLLDSAAAGANGCFTILAAYPRDVIWQDQTGAVHRDSGDDRAEGGFLIALDQAMRRERTPGVPSVPAAPDNAPFRGGWIVFLGYEIANEVEPRLSLAGLPRQHPQGPAAFAMRVGCGLVYDHQLGRAWAFAEASDAHRLPTLCDAVATRTRTSLPAAGIQLIEEDPALFRERVGRALEYIRAGDIYQANLSRPWRGRIAAEGDESISAAALYERLRISNPAPFAALVQFQDWRLLSSSPERLVRTCGRQVETRPIAGTRPRSRIASREHEEIATLIAHPKERAEHIMLIDLERNDLGRICRPGTVRADEFMAIESYPHVHHIVSNVSGELLPTKSPLDVLRAVFPGGTITGCPKFRCMQIIAELEQEARQAYTGSLGYINLDGSMDFNILIRTLTVRGRDVELRCGAGIVADSDADQELQETRAKARGVLLALDGVVPRT